MTRRRRCPRWRRSSHGEYPSTDGGKGIALVSLRDQLLGDVEQPLLFVALASALVLLLACVNVANLLVMRLPARGREMAVRVALGASRGRLARQLLVEGLALAAMGGALGLGLAHASLGAIVALAPSRVGRLDGVGLNGVVLAASSAAVLVCGVVLGAIPALVVWRARPALDLRGAGAALGSRPRLRQTLVALEVGLAVVLVIAAALFGRSLVRLRGVDVGFDTHNLLTFSVSLTGERADDQARQVAFYDDVLGAIRHLPGVVQAGGAVTMPVGGDDFNIPLFADGQPIPPPGQERHVGYQIVTARWFDTLGMRILRGRGLTTRDNDRDAPVAVVNGTLARELWPGGDAVGQRVTNDRGANRRWLTVVGVVSDIRHLGPAAPPRPEIYEPYYQNSFPFLEVAVRTAGDPLALVPAVRAAVARIDPTQPVSGVDTMQDYLEHAYGDERFLSTLTLTFGVLALALAAIGVYGVVGWSTSQRTRELGLRTALGATPRGLSGLVLREGLAPVWVGVLGGLAGTLVLARAVRGLLFDTGPADPTAYLAATATVLAAAALACWVPAHRAARVDPIEALREG